jgi:uncharacterized protein YjbI with pentapeptide repeats
MANEEHLDILKKGYETWNAWRGNEKIVRADLSGADLSGAKLSGFDLNNCNLRRSLLVTTDLRNADLSAASLREAHLFGTKLNDANLSWSVLYGTFFYAVDLDGTKFYSAEFNETVFTNTDLRSCIYLDTCVHSGPSTLDHRTLQRSGPLPLVFLRGVGLPDAMIDYLPSLLNQAIQFYSCFISYSSKDQAFAERLHADLQANGVRCWFAPHDMPIGAKILDAIDEAIRLRDKVLLVLSEGAIASDWVEGEVTRALDEERERKKPLLFPIRLDGAVMETTEAWARLLRGQRNIGDFTQWKSHDAYQNSLKRLLRDLTVHNSTEPTTS